MTYKETPDETFQERHQRKGEEMRQRILERKAVEFGLMPSSIYFIFTNGDELYEINELDWTNIYKLLRQRQESVPASFDKILRTTIFIPSGPAVKGGTLIKGLRIEASQVDAATVARGCNKLLERVERELNWLSRNRSTPFPKSASVCRDILSLQKTDERKFKLITTTVLIALPNTFIKEFGQWIVRQIKFSAGLESRYQWQHSEQEKKKNHLAREERLGQVLRGMLPFLQKVEANGMIITGLFDKRAL